MNDLTEEQLHASLNLIPAQAWCSDRSGSLTFVNQQYADYLGLEKQDPLRLGSSRTEWSAPVSFLHPDDDEENHKFWSTCIASESPGEAVCRIRDAVGHFRWFRRRAIPRLTENGTLQGWIGVNFDVEDRKQAEFYLAEGERIGHLGTWAFNTTNVEYWSDGLFRIHGLAPGKLPSTPELLAIVHPEDRAFMAQAVRCMLAERTAFDFTKRIVRPDGSIRYIRYVGKPVTKDEIFEGFVGIGIDVTEQTQLAAELRRSEKEWQQIVDLSPQLLGVLGPKCEHVYLNPTAIEYFGITLDDWLQGAKFGNVHPDDRENQTAFQSNLLIDSTQYSEVRLRKSDGTYRWQLTCFSPALDNQGKLLRWYISCTDIDERKKAEERLLQENVALREEIDKTSMFEEIVGTSPALMALLSRVTKIAGSDSTVLIAGETGTGKELVARAIHRRSRRLSKPFVAVNCAAIPRELIASELFGHEKGAFTGATQRRLGRFEVADGGTILLDEIGELLPDAQAVLLRVLQEQEFERVGGSEIVRVDVRVIAATNRDLEKAVTSGTFREDLFYRLNVVPVDMPPLRERKTDIPLLVEYFIDRFARKMGTSFRHVNKRTLEYLQSYPWPGNIRELQNVIERSVIVCDSEEFMIDGGWLSASPSRLSPVVLPNSLAAHEKTIIEEVLRSCDGRVFGPTGAAARLGIPRSTLESKVRALKIDKSQFRQRAVKE